MKYIKKFLVNKINIFEKRSFLFLMFSNVLLILVNILSNFLLARILTVENYGEYKYCLVIINFLVIFLNFGYQETFSYNIAKSTKVQKIKNYLIFYFYLTFFLKIFLLLCLYIINKYIKIEGYYYIALLTFSFLAWHRLLMKLLRGSGNIILVSLETIGGSLLFLIIIIIYYYYNISFTGNLAIYYRYFTYSLIHLIVIIILIRKIKSTFNRLVIKEIIKDNKEYGLHIYIGGLFSIGINEIISVIIGGITAKESFAYYSFALSLATLVTIFPNMIATINFKKNVNMNKIDLKQIRVMLILSFLIYILLNIFGTLLIKYLFPKYVYSIKYLRLLSLGYTFHGLGDYFNIYLASKGKGKRMKKSSIIIGLISLIVTVLMVKKFGIYGLAISKLIVSLTYMLFTYLLVSRINFEDYK